MRNAKRLQRLADDILDVTKIESESLNLKKEFFNLNDVITNGIDDIITNVAKNNQQGDFIKLLYQPSDIFIDADKSRITQVIFNLLDNAIKFSKAKVKGGEVGIININTEKVDDQAVVTITDTGTGLDPEIMPRLFEKFASKSFQGTGIFILCYINISMTVYEVIHSICKSLNTMNEHCIISPVSSMLVFVFVLFGIYFRLK